MGLTNIKPLEKYLTIDRILLLLIMIAATGLRFYNIGDLYFHFDEFSAFFRTGFNNFGELIRKGVVETDTHPAGVQVFLNYWVKIAGPSQTMFKLPFILMGIGAVYMGYRVGRRWFNATVGLIVALFLGFTEYALTYTLFARPYASGLFFCLLLVWFWSRAFLFEEGNRKVNIAGYIISGALCAYDHYFALFFLGLVGISGLFVIRRHQYLPYIISSASIIVLFLPHLRIFFIQLGKGGVEDWLAKPTPRFFIEYLEYILHFSVAMYALAGWMLLLSVMLFASSREKRKRQLLLFSWVSITWLTAYFYSIYRSSVLQYSVLIFTFPFLIMLVYSFLKDLKPWLKSTVVLLFIALSVYTLADNRQYFSIMYDSGYKGMLAKSEKFVEQYGLGEVTVMIHEPEKIQNYYIEKLGLNSGLFIDPGVFKSNRQFIDFLKEQDTRFFIIGGVGFPEPSFIPLAETIYPYMVREENWFLCDLFIFSKEKPDNYAGPADSIVFEFHKQYPADEADGRVNTSMEYLSLYEGSADSVIEHKNNRVILSCRFESDTTIQQAELIGELWRGQTRISRQVARFDDFQFTGQQDHTVYLPFKLSDLRLNPHNCRLKIYVWNRGFENFTLENFKMMTHDGNPILYGLFEKIPD